jgi:hypothetical protein
MSQNRVASTRAGSIKHFAEILASGVAQGEAQRVGHVGGCGAEASLRRVRTACCIAVFVAWPLPATTCFTSFGVNE